MMRIMTTTVDMTTIKSILKTGAFCFGFLILSCEANDKLSAEEIVERSCEQHGGLDNWRAVKSLSFDKSTRLYHPDGSVESDVNQNQVMTFSPRRTIKINSIDASKVSMVLDESFVRKRIDGQLITDSLELERTRRSLLAAEYVIKQPFALLDDGVELSLEDEEIIDGKSYHVISVKYEGDRDDSDKWSYYFNKDDYTLSFNKVVLKDHTSWIENLTYDEDSGFKFNSRRKSYRLNEKGEKTFLRAEYYYRNFEVLK